MSDIEKLIKILEVSVQRNGESKALTIGHLLNIVRMANRNFKNQDFDGDFVDQYQQMQHALQNIRELASWHYDESADETDMSPDDMTAHVNGLIIQECDRGLGK